jgi:hypothetical protein
MKPNSPQLWIGFLILLGLVACSTAKAQSPSPRLVGALDVVPLALGALEDIKRYTGIEWEVSPSANGIQEVMDGNADAVIIGREPTTQELEKLESHLVAYDAVCFLINSRTYEGGIQVNQTGSVIEYQKRTGGLRDLSLSEIEQHLDNVYRASGERWLWNGFYEEFKATKDSTGRLVKDIFNPQYSHGFWVRTPVYIYGEAMQRGKFDTQSNLFQLMGWDDTILENADIGYIPSIFESEEEVISFRFILAPLNPNPVNSSAFNFYLLPASRQVTERALKQGFALRPIRIDGDECVGDAADIYLGRYPLSRKVYLLARRPISTEIAQMVDYLQSPGGQERISQLSYLPVPAEELQGSYQP